MLAEFISFIVTHLHTSRSLRRQTIRQPNIVYNSYLTHLKIFRCQPAN